MRSLFLLTNVLICYSLAQDGDWEHLSLTQFGTLKELPPVGSTIHRLGDNLKLRSPFADFVEGEDDEVEEPLAPLPPRPSGRPDRRAAQGVRAAVSAVLAGPR